MCVSKARGWPGLRAAQNLQMPHPRDCQGGQMPRSSPGGGGGRGALGAAQIDWCIITDALLVLFAIGVESHRLSFMLKKKSICVLTFGFFSWKTTEIPRKEVFQS